MNAVLINKEYLDYTSKKTGQLVNGWTITYLKSRRNKSDNYYGYDVDNLFIRNDDDNKSVIEQLAVLMPGDHFQPVFEVDGRYSYLVDLVYHESNYFDFSKPI